MKMKLNKKGFTLIELLAVIVILGILMMTAIPAVTRAIAKSRRNTYWQNMKSYAKAAATPFLDGEYVSGTDSCPYPGSKEFVVIPLDIIELEQGDATKSSFKSEYETSGNCAAKVIVANIGEEGKDDIQWYVIGMDKAKNGINNFTNINKLKLSSVLTGTTCKNGVSLDSPSAETKITLDGVEVAWKATCASTNTTEDDGE